MIRPLLERRGDSPWASTASPAASLLVSIHLTQIASPVRHTILQRILGYRDFVEILRLEIAPIHREDFDR
jgi:hypothetical protein